MNNKHLIISIIISILLSSSLFAGLQHKSAMLYYGENISYPMVGIHEYIIVQPQKTNHFTHGFSLYKKSLYAYVSIGEIHASTEEYGGIKKEWILARNEAWDSEVLDISNPECQEYLFSHLIEPRIAEGFENFFFDTLDSYQLYAKTDKERQKQVEALSAFIHTFHARYPQSKLILNRGFELIDSVHDAVEAVLFESYYRGLGGSELGYKKVSDGDREWLDIQIEKIKSYNLDVISVEYLPTEEMDKAQSVAEKILQKGMIPYIANRELDIYGTSSKNSIKREILTLIDGDFDKRIESSAHRYGAQVLEYLGYIQKLKSAHEALPPMKEMRHYGGVIIWLNKLHKEPKKLLRWIKELQKEGIKVAIVDSFGVDIGAGDFKELGIVMKKELKYKQSISYEHSMLSYEIEPSLAAVSETIEVEDAEPLLEYKFRDGSLSTPAALTSWGGYAVRDAFIVNLNDNDLWVINPYEFFKEALELKELLVPDTTTQNGKRLLFTHVDGDGMMNRVEGDSKRFSGEVILEDILKKYPIPHSVSVIGAEIYPNGLYPELSPLLSDIARKMYALDNVEAATHTFSHPFFWGEIKNDTLNSSYRLAVKEYKFSLENELEGSIRTLNERLVPADKHKAKSIFWSGDCAPRENALEHIYANGYLAINGGDTTIQRTAPWLSHIAPLGLERGEYYQIYTGAQNENVYTNDWLGPFWGFKKVVQTFELTNSPKRLKPIDIYYHLYSGSKMASLKALRYVFDWAMQEDVYPIFTSEYIPKVMDYYALSMCEEDGFWLVDGMRDLKSLRWEKKDASINLEESRSVVGLEHFESHTYIALSPEQRHLLSSRESPANRSYLIGANAKLVAYTNSPKKQSFSFESHIDLKLSFHLEKGCKLTSTPEASKQKESAEGISLEYKDISNAEISIECN